MPDGDRHHPRLRQKYQRPYKQLCEGVTRPDDLARGIMERLKGDVKDVYPRIAFALRASTQRLELLTDSLDMMTPETIDWRAKHLEVRRAIEITAQDHREGDLVVRATQRVLQELESGRVPQSVKEELYREFVNALYDARFGDVVVIPSQSCNVPPHVIAERLEELDPHIRPQLDAFARQLQGAREGVPVMLRMMAHRVERIYDLDTDIEEVHR